MLDSSLEQNQGLFRVVSFFLRECADACESEISQDGLLNGEKPIDSDRILSGRSLWLNVVEKTREG